jgi:hypothetical protein
LLVVDLAAEDLDRYRPAARRADKLVGDLRLAGLAVARVAEGGQRRLPSK